MHQITSSRFAGVVRSLFALLAGGFASMAFAAAPGDAASVEEIIVTGTHLANTGFDSPSPVSVYDAKRNEQLAITNVADGLFELPSFRATTTPESNFYNTTGNIGANFADLRGLSPARTLVLVDNRRFTPSNASGNVDLNSIPSALVARTEVVTGGASAAYGSDAVAGVVNLILDTKLSGIKSQLQYGQSSQSDDRRYQGSIAGGTDFGARGHVIAGVEFEDDKGIDNCYARAWCYSNVDILANPAQQTNGLPAQILAPAVNSTRPYTGLFQAAVGPGGVTSSVPTGAVGLTFNNDGTPRPFNYGSLAGASLMVGGEALDGRSPQRELDSLVAPVQRVSALTHADYQLSDSVSVFTELSFARVEGQVRSVPLTVSRTPIALDNAYLPDSVRQAAIAANQSSLLYSDNSGLQMGFQSGESVNKTYGVVLGARGSLFDGWTWDAYYQYGRNDGDLNVAGNAIPGNVRLALDAVVGANGQIVCRSTLTNPASKCSALNLFGIGQPVSQATRNFVLGTIDQSRTIDQQVVSLNLSGAPLRTWAGPLSTAFGAEYRSDKVDGSADPLSLAQAFQNNAGSAISGKVDVKEAYAEVGVPLASGMKLADQLDLNGAVRYTDYSTTGSIQSWKAGLVYAPIQSLRFRATRSRDVRAPNIQELFATPQTVLVSVIDTVTGTQNQILQVTGGNPQLKPEKADTTTVGMVFQPRGGALDGLQFSVDYYDIDVLNAIDVIDPQSLISLCAAGSAVACQSVKRNALGQLVMITGNTTNLTSVRTSGLEFAADYLLPLSRISASLPGELQLRADATHVYKLQSKDPNGLSIDRVGNTTSTISSTSASNSEGVPDWNVNLVANYSWNPWSFTLQGRFISASIYDPRLLGPDQPGYNPAALNSISNNHIPSAFYLNAGAQFDLSKAVQLYAFVDNLLDRDPPAIPLFSTGAYYDTIGRRYRVGVRANF